MTTTLPERPRWYTDDPAIASSARPQASVTVECGVPHPFSPVEFDATGVDGAGLTAVVLVGLERVGVLSLHGSPLMLNDPVPIESIAAGDLQYLSGSGEPGPDHDSFLFSVHDGTGWNPPSEMHVHTVLAEHRPYSDSNSEATTPTALDGSVTTAEDVTYVFKPTDFNFQGAESDFVNVQFASVDTCGVVKLHGGPVVRGQVIEVEDIDLELLTYEPADPGMEGFEYLVHDGVVWSDAEYSMVINITSHYLPPTASDSEIVMELGEARVLRAEDFRYNDFAGDELARVSLSNFALGGTLRLDGADIESKQVVTRTEIDAGQLEYAPAAVGVDDSFSFRVHDRTAYSVAAYHMKFIVKEPRGARVSVVAPRNPAKPAEDAPTVEDPSVSNGEPESIQPHPVMGARHFDLAVTAKQDSAYVFTAADLTPDRNPFSEIGITDLEICGLLQLDAMAVTHDQRITREMIDEGRLTFLPMGSGKCKYFDYRIRRGLKWSPVTCAMWIEIVPPDA